MSLSLMYDGTKMEKSFTVNSYSYGESWHKSRYFINTDTYIFAWILNYTRMMHVILPRKLCKSKSNLKYGWLGGIDAYMHEDAITFDAWLIPGCVHSHTHTYICVYIWTYKCTRITQNIIEGDKIWTTPTYNSCQSNPRRSTWIKKF